MNSESFVEKSKDLVIEFYNTLINCDYTLDSGSVEVIFFSSCESSYKVLLSTPFDNLLYLVTYSDMCFRFDVYSLCYGKDY